MRAFRRLRVQEWMEARASQFTLADAFHPALAALLKLEQMRFRLVRLRCCQRSWLPQPQCWELGIAWKSSRDIQSPWLFGSALSGLQAP